MIEFQDVTVCYEPQKLHPVRSLDALSLKIERGDWVFLVGPSGAGKSSLLKLIFAGTRAQSGRILVDGVDISHIAAREVPNLRRKIGIVFQDFQLLNEKTAWENVAFTLRVIGTPQAEIIKSVPLALETVGLTHRAQAFPHELSGGEQQRIAIARAIVNDPKILLCDEPTGNLDPQTAREVGELLTKINRERGTTIVMATHDRHFVDTLARRVVRLKAGHVMSDETPGFYGSDEEIEREETGQLTIFDTEIAPAIAQKAVPVPQIVAPPAETPISPAEMPVPTGQMPVPAAEMLVPSAQTSVPSAQTSVPSAQTPVPTGQMPIPTGQMPIPTGQMPIRPSEMPIRPVEMPAPSPQSAAPRRVAEIAPLPTPAAPPPISVSVRPAPAPHSENEEFLSSLPVARPMARRIAPAEKPGATPVAAREAHELDPNAQKPADSGAPLGSPENPIVQFEEN